jgi:hypothetical protein
MSAKIYSISIQHNRVIITRRRFNSDGSELWYHRSYNASSERIAAMVAVAGILGWEGSSVSTWLRDSVLYSAPSYPFLGGERYSSMSPIVWRELLAQALYENAYTGDTQTLKMLNRIALANREHFLRFNMSEYRPESYKARMVINKQYKIWRKFCYMSEFAVSIAA